MNARLIAMSLIYLLASCNKDEATSSTTLKGMWVWKSSCGGVVGCTYPTDTTFQTMTIGDSSLEIKQKNKVKFTSSYTVKNITTADNAKTYQLEFNNGNVWTVTVSNHHLTTDYDSVLFSYYERML